MLIGPANIDAQVLCLGLQEDMYKKASDEYNSCREIAYNWEDFTAALDRKHMILAPWYQPLSLSCLLSPHMGKSPNHDTNLHFRPSAERIVRLQVVGRPVAGTWLMYKLLLQAYGHLHSELYPQAS